MKNLTDTTITEEVLVYLAECPEYGPLHQIFDNADILIAGGVRGIEADLETRMYRFVRLGVIQAQKNARGISFTEEDLAALPDPADHDWRLGRHSPAYGGTELERQIFESVLRAIRLFLETWQHEEDGLLIGYVAKNVQHGCLASVASTLCVFGQAYNIIRLNVLKYWFEPKWKTRALCEDQILDQFTLVVPVRICWSTRQDLVFSEVQGLHYC